MGLDEHTLNKGAEQTAASEADRRIPDEATLAAYGAELGCAFVDLGLLKLALTHSSFANERGASGEFNERLEFLGDAVLELGVSQMLYLRFPHAREGDLTSMRAKLVAKPTLAEAALRLGLDGKLLLGKGEEAQGGRTRKTLLGDAFEALLGAIFLDAGFEAAKDWTLARLEPFLPRGSQGRKPKDFKSLLQEFTQDRFKARPVYTLVGSSGPEHDKRFRVKADIPDGSAFFAEGVSVKAAEQTAAQAALNALRGPRPGDGK